MAEMTEVIYYIKQTGRETESLFHTLFLQQNLDGTLRDKIRTKIVTRVTTGIIF